MPAVLERPCGVRNYDYSICKANSTPADKLPETYTIPEENIPPVHDQDVVNACVAFAMCQCAESNDLANGRELTHYSPSWNYGRDESRNGYTGEGLYSEAAVKGASKIGFVPELLFPNFNMEVPEVLDICAKRDDILPESSTRSIKGYSSINYAMVEMQWNTIRQALYDNKKAILITSRKFFGIGGHAIIAIGWSNTNGKQKGKYIEFQNSWDTTYKNNGRWFIPLSQINECFVLSWEDFVLPFKDVLTTDWFYDYVKSSYFSGLIKGVTDTEFMPIDSIIRGDVAVIIDRLFDKVEYSVNTFIKSQNQQGKHYKEIKFEDKVDGIAFKDVDPASYYYKSINKVFANGIILGDDEGNFNPEAHITRAEMAAIVVRTKLAIYDALVRGTHNIDMKEKAVDMSLVKDVTEEDWFYGYVKEAYEMDLMNGLSDDTFGPYEELTRAEASTVLYRLFKSVDYLLMEV